MTQLIEERHQALTEQLAAHVDEELSAEERAQMEAHLLGTVYLWPGWHGRWQLDSGDC